ncbi:MAG TPA: hypothetical protein VIY66_03265 [Candidatus Acidoferrales bacterium]
MIRGALAILAGIVTLTITSFAIEAAVDPLMTRLFPHALPNRAAISYNLSATLFLFSYTFLCVAAGGYVTAWLARRRPVLHSLLLGVLQVALTVLAMTSSSLRHEAPLRNWIGALLFTIPAAWCGGLLRAKQATKSDPQEAPRRATA